VKLHLSTASGRNAFTAYGEGYVMVNGARHESSLIVLPDRLLPWDATSVEGLSAGDFSIFLDMKIEILLLGTGKSQRFPPPALTRRLVAAGIGLEVMDLQAACRTYNILMAEERRVAAALLFA